MSRVAPLNKIPTLNRTKGLFGTGGNISFLNKPYLGLNEWNGSEIITGKCNQFLAYIAVLEEDRKKILHDLMQILLCLYFLQILDFLVA